MKAKILGISIFGLLILLYDSLTPGLAAEDRIKGGAKGYSRKTSKTSYSSSAYSSSHSNSEQPFQRQYASQSHEAPSRICDRLNSPNDGSLRCQQSNDKYVCTATCRDGYAFPDGSTTLALECAVSGVWTPLKDFPDCAAVGRSSQRDRYSQQHSTAGQYSREGGQYSREGGQYSREGGQYSQQGGQYSQQRTSNCGQPNSPSNGAYRCQTSNERYVCTGTCMDGYAFPDGSTTMLVECSSVSGVWTPFKDFPDCQDAAGNYQGDRYSQQLTSKCDRPQSPMNGAFRCQMSNDRYSCTATCRDGYAFPDGSTTLAVECSQTSGVWSPFKDFPDCEVVRGSDQWDSYSQQRVSGSYDGDRYNQQHAAENYPGSRHTQQLQQVGPCARPKSPENGQIYCREDSHSVYCQATCNPGFEFPDGLRQIALSCSVSEGSWEPRPSFEDCQMLCHPPCQNGAQCLPHNQCSCLTDFRGNRCQYPLSNCDFNRLLPTMVIFECAHRPEFTECHISCPPGMTFDPPSSPLYRCTVDGRWNPPTSPKCIKDDLCEQPPSPVNGRVVCSGNHEMLICSAQCMPGFLFPDGFSELVSQCSYRTGQWVPTVNFPDCEPTCHPRCENGGRCLGHNQCLCSPQYRGSRCQYPILNCESQDRFSAVAFECQHSQEETICYVNCGDTGRLLDPPHPTEYTCSPDGRWQPSQKPKCIDGYQDQRQQETLRGGHGLQTGRSYDQPSSFQDFRGQEPIGHDFDQQSFGQEQVDYDLEDESSHHVQKPVEYDRPKTYEKQQVEETIEREHIYDLRQQPGSIQNQLREEEEVQQERQKKKLSDFDEIDDNSLFPLPVDDDTMQMKKGTEDQREREDEVDEEDETRDSFDMEESSSVRGVCSVWGYHHYRTFDSWVYTFPGTCTYLLSSVCDSGDATINVRHECDASGDPCSRGVEIHLPGDHFFITTEGLTRNEQPWTIPTHVGPLAIERITRYVVARLTSGFSVWIADDESVHVVASDSIKGRTCGLCGNFDGIPQNDAVSADGKAVYDVYAFGNSWKVQNAEGCTFETEEEMPCSLKSKEKRLASDQSSLRCATLFSAQFVDCQNRVKTDFYFRMCQMDCCSLQAELNCECSSMTQFFIECTRAGGDFGERWRTDAFCPLKCTNGTEYSECGPTCPPTCTNIEPTCPFEECVDGCHCPDGTVLEDGQCIPVENCPCHYGDRKYEVAETMQQDCNTCVCKSGQWQCTDEICPATCTISGNHYMTFDGLTFDLISSCSHHLVEYDNFSVTAEISTRCRNSPLSSCMRSITIHTPEGALVKLKPDMEVTVNRQEIASLPVSAPGVYVSQATSIFMKAQLTSGLEILWDGRSKVEVTAPSHFFRHLRGLCGTYTHSQADDFLTPEGDTELTSEAFASKWKLDDTCLQLQSEVDPVEEKPCDQYPQRRDVAAKLCRVLNGPQFEACHDLVDQEPYYSMCMDDTCGCDSRPQNCLCSSLASYASACARKERPLPWRREVPECGIHCEVGQVYEECANPCLYSCAVIAGHLNCKEGCVEGCVCPPGLTLDSDGHCGAISSCSCTHSGHVYPPEFQQMRGREMCECSDGHWSCRQATASDIILTPPPNVAVHCSESSHQEFTDCVSDCPLTCSNLHHHEPCTVAVCTPGCRCKHGYVLNTQSNICVLPRDCPCHHADHSYEDGAEVKVDCNQCVCDGGQWRCESNPCPGTCHAWGDSHYVTFDGKTFDFQGECDYVLVRARIEDGVTYSVVIQNVPCGTEGVTCSKSVVVSLDDWNVILTRENPLPSVSRDSRLTVSQMGVFTLVHSDIGISLQWDRTTRINVIAEPVWKSKLQGLCGDFNEDSSDDFRPPSGGMPIVRAKVFADSWRVHDYCQPAHQVEDVCDIHPERRVWAREKCGVLKSDLFRHCHSHVELEAYYSRCVFDSCACDTGGDCQCLCAAVAAYAQKCAQQGVIVAWRSQELCPVQCEACDRYSPCISLCSPETCDTLEESKEGRSCAHEPCVDGCETKPCEPGYVYKDLGNLTCVSEEECGLKPCMVINGVSYREGERINDDEIGDPCQSCYCKLGEMECVGVPCKVKPLSLPIPMDRLKGCELTGWTDWINSAVPAENDGNDFEDLANLETNGRIPCPVDHVTSIQCRDVNSGAPSETTGQDVSCSLEDGLRCESSFGEDCLDYEIRLYCDCVEKVTCPPEQVWDDCAFHCDSICQSFLQDLLSSGECGGKGECVPGCTMEVCQSPYVARDSDTCILPGDCTCQLETGYLLAPGEVVSNGCEKCQCLNNSLICSTLQECAPTTSASTPEHFTIRQQIGGVPGALGIPGETSCVQGWSAWVSSRKSDGYGETEPLDDVEVMSGLGCLEGHFTAIECRDVDTEHLHHLSGLTGVTCELQSGYSCQNSQQARGRLCRDYEIRTYCDCKGQTIAPAAFETTTPSMRTTRKQRPAFGRLTTITPCAYWSDWVNKHRPRRGPKYGEREDTLPFILQQTEGFCIEGSITEIECKDAKRNRDYRETKESNLICDLGTGFTCNNADQSDGKCFDYKIRYFCSCEEAGGPEITLYLTSSAPSHVYPCNDFVLLIDGPQPLDDVQLKASSSLSPKSGPQSGRLSSQPGLMSEGSWTAAVADQSQFIEVDFGEPRVIYGVVTKGREEYNEWVTSYRLFYSPDGVGYAYYSVDNDISAENFPGNYDSTSPVRHILELPFEARIVRLEPVTWEGHISLRWDLLGCSEAMATTMMTSMFPAKGRMLPAGGHMLPAGGHMLPEAFPGESTPYSPFEVGSTLTPRGSEIPEAFSKRPTPVYPPPFQALTSQSTFSEEFGYATPSYIPPCDDFVLLIDGPLPMDDDRLRASSIFSPNDTPSNGRLVSDGAWTAKKMDTNQYIKVDLGEPRIIYGVVTKGKEDADEWVTSYRLQYSFDADTYAYYADEEDNPKVFPGNYDDSSEVNNMLENPIEARVVAIEPLTWEGRISLRWDLLGCSEAAPPFETTILPAFGNIPTTYPPPFEVGSTTAPRGSEIPGAFSRRPRPSRPPPPPFGASTSEIALPEEFGHTTPSYIPPCDDFVLLIDGPLPVDDEHLRASSSFSRTNTPSYGRLSSDRSWTANEMDTNQYIKVDLGEPRIIYGVVTKGKEDEDEWVTSYRLQYSFDADTYAYYTDEEDNPKVFSGNYDDSSEVNNMLENPIEARIVSLEPLTWEGRIALRWDLLGCSEAGAVTTAPPTTTPEIPIFYSRTTPTPQPQVCEEPMGLENGLLSDSQLSASSHYDPSLSPEKGRLGSDSAWAVAIANDKQYLQVDFLEPRNITGIITKGREGVPQWVTAYKVAYSNDGTTWNEVLNDMGVIQEFAGNYDEESIVTNLLPSMMRTRYLRIIPTNWKNWISLQAEVLGCFHPYECKEPMGLESGLVSNAQLSSSSAYDKSLGAESGRLSSTNGWVAKTLDRNQFLQIDFLEGVNLTAIVTKGRLDAPQWVKAYEVAHSDDGVTWSKMLNDNGVVQEFQGNSDSESAVTNVFSKPVSSRYLRILPARWKGWISMRAEVLGCHHSRVCQDPMGLEDGLLSDSQLSASSALDSFTSPSNARLNDISGWSAGILDNEQFLQVDFMEPRNITAVVTKGRGDEPKWVSSYQLAHSMDGEHWTNVEDDQGEVKKFKGNDDQSNPVVNVLPDTIETRYLRILPRKWKKWISMRLEVLGCYHPYYCREPMGIENGLVSNVQLSASSSYGDNLNPANARLDSDTSWTASTLEEGEYIQVDFINPQNVTAVVTRGRNDAAQWVTAYVVKVSYDSVDWMTITDHGTGNPKEFPANYDSDSSVTNTLPEEVTARYLRILPTKWKNWISLRFDILGCYHPSVCTDPMGMENGLLSDSQITASSFYDDLLKPANARISDESSAWAAETTEDEQYLQIDFLEPRNVSAIVTKGRPDEDHWVSSYYVSYSRDNATFTYIRDEYRRLVEFIGNDDRNTSVINPLPTTLETRYLRIIPVKWNKWISLRAELLGCFHPYPTEEEITFGMEKELPEYVKALVQSTALPAMVGECPDPMEEEKSLLDDAEIVASSSASGSTPALLRLNTRAPKGLSSGWVPRADDLHPVVIIELPETKWITSINIQGRGDADQWVKSFRVVASNDHENWQPVFDPNGNEEMEGNRDQSTVVGHYFKDPVAAKFIKIIPETWNRRPSLRMDLRGCSHPPLGPTTISTVPALELCPEMEIELVTNCPSFCPAGLLCNGEKCVDPVDCVCVHDDKIFMVSDKFVDEKCMQCDCSLGGHSICSSKVCAPCENETKQILHDNCSCSCEKCDYGMQICPSSGECIPQERWCDGIIDCPDDETNCLVATTVPTEITSIFPLEPENATCEILGKRINTLDGQELVYDTCNHVVLQDITDGTFNVSVHKDCSVRSKCEHWLLVNQESHTVKVTSDLDVQFDGHHYTASQLVLLSQKSHLNLTVEKVGEHIIVKSLVKGFTVIYDVRAHLKVGVSPDLLKQVAGLCGFYSGSAIDDQQKPDGRKAFTSKEFGDSWAVDDSLSCKPSICPLEFMDVALETCDELREDPFTNCAEVVNINTHIEFCMSSTCECLQNGDGSANSCKCSSFMPLVEACEKSLGPNALRNWRYKHSCVPDCPAGMEWNDCGPSCQLTCDAISLDDCSKDCMAGCFCPPGTVLNGDKCISPEHCSDKVCQGFGDPHLQTYDGLLYPFQAVGSFLISADEDTNFAVEGLTELCTFFNPITCVVGLQVSYKGHIVRVQKNKVLKLDGVEIPLDKLPVDIGDLNVIGFPGRTFVISIPDINVEARYFEENAGFAVKIPSKRYFNKTIGLCGNCNANIEDELKDEPINEFVCSWLTDGNEAACQKSFLTLPEVVNPMEVCNKLNDKIFSSCHLLVDPKNFIDACNFDAMHSGDDFGSFCKTAMEYARQCCQAGEIINDWPGKFGCNISCPSGLEFIQCHDGCPQTCESVRNESAVMNCQDIKVDGCFCPGGKILKDDECIDSIYCDTCDSEGHVLGDIWDDGPCKKCHCSQSFSVDCVVEICPESPICSSKEILIRRNSSNESCCQKQICGPIPKTGCHAPDIPSCPSGQVAVLHITLDECPLYKCECDLQLCPPIVKPTNLEVGQELELMNDTCCSRMEAVCHAKNCPEEPSCSPGLQLTEIPGECCVTYKCKPPEDVCIHTHQYKVVDGYEVPIDPTELIASTYKVGDTWFDGLCENCSCILMQSQLVPHCVMEQCPILANLPEKKDYELYEYRNPNKCCPEIFRMQCKDEHGNIYEADEEWQSLDDPCVNYICEPTVIGGVQKVKKVIDCLKCPKTSDYIPPSKRLGQCCGICRPSKCEEDDTLYEVGETWDHPSNPCQKAECINAAGSVKTIYTNSKCPALPMDCPKDKILKDEDGCCEICNITSEISCSTGPIPLEETVGFFSTFDAVRGGICVNDRPVLDVLKCSGACHSESYYSLEDGEFKSMCKCCKVNITVSRPIELSCPDGSQIKKNFLQPSTCQCSKCAPEGKSKWVPPGNQQRETELFEKQEQQPFNPFQQEEEEEEEDSIKPFNSWQSNPSYQQQNFNSFQQQEEEDK